MEPFKGWPPEALEFFRELEHNNNREWFNAHRDTYDQAVRGPLEALLGEVQDKFGDAKVFRPNRDIRFSADKTPYKTQISAVLSHPGGGGWYLSLDKDGVHTGGGSYSPDRQTLAKIRTAISADEPGERLEQIVARMAGSGLELMTEGSLKGRREATRSTIPASTCCACRTSPPPSPYRPARGFTPGRRKPGSSKSGMRSPRSWSGSPAISNSGQQNFGPVRMLRSPDPVHDRLHVLFGQQAVGAGAVDLVEGARFVGVVPVVQGPRSRRLVFVALALFELVVRNLLRKLIDGDDLRVVFAHPPHGRTF